MFTALHTGSGETGTYFKAADSTDGEHRFCQVGLQLFKSRISQSRGNALYTAFNNPPGTVPFFNELKNPGGHPFGGIRIAGPHGVFFYEIFIKTFTFYTGGGLYPGQYMNALLFQPFAGHSPGSHPGGGFPARGPPAAPPVPKTVLLKVGVVRMTRAELINDIPVVRGAGIGVVEHHGHGCPGGFPLEDPREKDDFISFFPGGGKI